MTARSEPHGKVFLSVVVCTHNRSSCVARLLSELVRQIEGHAVELILVNSASEDPHRAALRETVIRHSQPAIRLIELDQKGISLARNAGWKAANAEWVAYIDDDEMPSPSWLADALALIARLPENCGACGGNVRPYLGTSDFMDTWAELGPRWRAFLGEIAAEGEFDQTETPKFGVGHSLIRTAALRKIEGFNPELGRDGKSLLSGEEVLMLMQMNARGWRVWHSSCIWVLHDIGHDRLKRSWATNRAYWEGVSTARVNRLNKIPNAISSLSVSFKTLPLLLMLPFAPRWYEFDLRVAFNWGLLVETVRAHQLTDCSAGRLMRSFLFRKTKHRGTTYGV